MTRGDGKPCERCGTSKWDEHRDCLQCKRERKRKGKPENPQKVRERASRWRRNHPDKARAISRDGTRKWKKNNPEADAASVNRRRTRKTTAGGNYTAAEWKALVEHYGNQCLCCGRADVKLTADHVVPVVKGGSSDIENIQPLCGSCNSKKKDRIIDYRPNAGLGRWIQRKLLG